MEGAETEEDLLGVEGVLGPLLVCIFSSTIRGLCWESMKRVPGGRGPAFGLRELKWEKREWGSIVDSLKHRALSSAPSPVQKMDDFMKPFT